MYYAGAFDHVVDVAVLGFGDAGAAAALTAHDAGAQVLIVEKQPAADHRPNSRYAAGFLMVPTDVPAATKYLTGLYERNGESADIDPSMIETLASETAANVSWLAEHGIECRPMGIRGEHTAVPGYEAINVHKVQPSPHANGYPGCPLYGALRALVEERGIEIRYATAASALLTDADGAVTGVRLEHEGATTHLGVRRGVVLAVGGYESDPRLKRQYLPVQPVHFYGTQHNTGDGIRLAQDIGADLWHMNVWPGHFVARFPGNGYGGGTGIDLWGSGRFGPPEGEQAPGSIFVDNTARRFIKEPGRQHAANLELSAMDAERLAYPRIPTWWIFDDARFGKATLVPTYSGPAGPVQDYTWSSENRAELDRGWIRSASSVRELALRCDLDPDTLAATVERYNAMCAAGRDDFGRDPGTLTPLTGPRYYAVPLWPGGSHTVGGPRRDAAARVAAARGGVIANLYSAGELGSMYGLLYPAGGASLAECLAFGRIAGCSAAANRGALA